MKTPIHVGSCAEPDPSISSNRDGELPAQRSGSNDWILMPSGLAAGDGPVQELTLQGDSAGSVRSISSRLVGRHQSDNIAAAAQVAALLRTRGIADVPLRVVAAGVEATRLGGRFETLRCAFGAGLVSMLVRLTRHWLDMAGPPAAA